MRERARDAVIQRLLRAARDHLGFEVAFVSQLVDGSRVFRYVDSDDSHLLLEVGGSDPAEESYCHYVVSQQLPQWLEDPKAHPVAAGLEVTEQLPVGSHVSIPLALSDGRVYGTFCCFSRSIHSNLGEPDLGAIRLLASMAAEYIEQMEREEYDEQVRRARSEGILADASSPVMVFQPLVELMTGEVVAVEALSRFPSWGEGPMTVFAQAWEADLGVELEVKAVRHALRALDSLSPEHRLSVNVSPMTLIDRAFLRIIGEVPENRLVVEVTEHSAVDDYDALRVARRQLSDLGILLAIDDVGMGFSGLHHILESAPDWLKIDQAVVRNVHTNPVKAAMIESLVSFGERVDMLVVAEGIETDDELKALTSLGVSVGQGYAIAYPSRLVDAVSA